MQIDSKLTEPATPADRKGGKAIFVDGPSLDLMKRVMGIRNIDFKGLQHALVAKIGQSRALSTRPVMTANPRHILPNSWLQKCASGAGFETMPITTEGGADDAALIAKIEAVSAETVSEIVLVTSDKDFIPVVIEKSSQGIKIYWVACAQHEVQDVHHRHLSKSVLDLADQGTIVFVELSRFASCLTYRHDDDDGKLVNGHGVRGGSDTDTMVVTIRWHGVTNRDRIELINDLTRIKERCGSRFDFQEIR